MHNPNEDHMNVVMRILRYLKSAPGKGLVFRKHGHLRTSGYTDADWAGNIIDRRSTSGYFTFVGGNLVTWRNKKQNVVARSSAEAEYRGIAQEVCELLWLRSLLKSLGFKQEWSMPLHCDNIVAVEIAHNPIQYDRTKHVEIDRHFIKEKLDARIISFPFVLGVALPSRNRKNCAEKKPSQKKNWPKPNLFCLVFDFSFAETEPDWKSKSTRSTSQNNVVLVFFFFF